jgi:predicted glycosyltransferase involved in capsule biosynthesis
VLFGYKNISKVLLPYSEVTFADFDYPGFRHFGFLARKLFKNVGLPIFRLWAYLMRVIPETRRTH